MVTGDTVNLAARLQSAAEPGTILVGERAHRLAADAFLFGEPVEVALKGHRPARHCVGRSRRIDRVGLARARDPKPPEPDGRAATGVATLMGLLEDAIESGTPRFGLVYGPAGIGKSSLLFGSSLRRLGRAARP